MQSIGTEMHILRYLRNVVQFRNGFGVAYFTVKLVDIAPCFDCVYVLKLCLQIVAETRMDLAQA